ncbi:putative MFS multidrug transporter [Exophiala viscosa]|uniref:MFS multidrug transporter n=1 Tax=Exophiala viscosa TaxID=2486360 RepID=A0AAN6DNW2_9EURO|nr:putative MFS multidrug transporter [Exophiala viscosa]KAI1620208.1 putative MFS multidrug transporter [Exophiala viscosa]
MPPSEYSQTNLHNSVNMSQINDHGADSTDPYTIFNTSQKAVIVTIVSVAATLSGFASNIYFPSLPQIAHDLSVSTNRVNLTVTCYMIFQGLSPTLWGAVSDALGRRITYCCTMVVFLGACIGLAETRDFVQLIVLRCVQSTGSASTIALGAGVIGDITRRGERGGYMGFYQGGVLMPVAIGPVIGGLLAGQLGWKSVFWFLAIHGAACLLLILLILPETLRSIAGNGSLQAKGIAKSILGTYQRKRYLQTKAELPDSEDRSHKARAIDFFGPIKILFHLKTFSAIMLVGIHYTVWQMVLTALSTLVSDRYHVTETQIGLIFLANGVGSVFGTLLTGKLLDLEYRKSLKKVGGDEQLIPIEKTRLKTAWIWSGLECASILIFGWTVDQNVHISVPIISLFFLGWAAISIQCAVSTYLVDIHHSQSASATASLNLIRCLMGAGGTAVVGPLIRAINVGWAFTLFALIMIISGVTVLILMVHVPRNTAGHRDAEGSIEQATTPEGEV